MRHIMTARVAVATLAALCLGAPTAAAQEAPATFEGVTMTPARIEVDLGTRQATQQLSLFNNGELPHEVDLQVATLGHELDGTPVFVEDAPSVATIRGETSFVLAPGETRTFVVDFAFHDQVSAYVGVLATLDGSNANTGTVGTISRLAGLGLLRGPGPWDQTLALRGTSVALSPDGTEATLLLDVENVGDAHVRPAGLVTISQAGQDLATVEFNGELVIPGFARRQVVSWVPPVGLTGTVDVTLATQDGQTFTSSVHLGDVVAQVVLAREGAGLPVAGAEFDGLAPVERLIWPLLIALFLLLATAWLWNRHGRSARPASGGSAMHRVRGVDNAR